MSKPPTISLPFTNYDTAPTSSRFNIFSGSRLRNRVLAFASSAAFFLICFLFLRRALVAKDLISTDSFSSNIRPEIPSIGSYDGADISYPEAEHLVIVAGHAIWLGGRSYQNDSDWYLEPHQMGQAETMAEHIKHGAHLAKSIHGSLLIFSGGNTRQAAGARTESQSYAELLEFLALDDPDLGDIQVTTEEFARDSYENLIFSIARFYEVTGRYPLAISVVGFEFKKDRFENIHRKAIQFPPDKFQYYGVDPPSSTEKQVVGELLHAKTLFDSDLYGCKTPELLLKKKGRNPYRRRHGYELSNPRLADLLAFCPQQGNTVFSGSLPW